MCSRLTVVVACVLVIGACANKKAPAEAALKSAQDSYNAVSGEAMKYVPDQARAVQGALSSAQAAFARGEYDTVMSQTQGLNAQITGLATGIAARKTQLASEWSTMSAGVPKLVEALKSRVDILGQSRSLPAGITRETVDSAKAGVASADQAWSEATAAATGGDIATAVAKATDVRTRVVALMRSLNMQVPAGGI
jgi:hypothetical protein